MLEGVNRRDFLKALSSAGIGASVGACSGSGEQPGFSAGAWGVAPPEWAHLLIPEERRPEGVLDLYLMGGMCPWDTFYTVPEYGQSNGTMFNTFLNPAKTGQASVAEYFERCEGGNRALTEPYAVDARGKTVHLGPWLYPLRDRPDILERTRVFVLRHLFEPHGVASPLALCGHPRGTPRMACTGAHVQRFWRDRGDPGRRTPHSYVLYSMDSEIAAQFDIHAASATGLHPASVRPLNVRLVRDNPLPEQLARAHLQGQQTAVDDSVEYYLRRFRERLGVPSAVRSLEELVDARAALRYSGDLVDVLTPDLLASVGGAECGFEAANGLDTTAMGLRLAVDLLTRPTHRARHVNVVDSGLINALGAGYDTHDYHVLESSRNVVHMSRLLAEHINRPDEQDPRKLDLDRHTVLLTTEFGRTPYVETGKEEGLDHWPFGYVVVAIGGFVDKERAGLVGAIDEQGFADMSVSRSFSPAEFRAAVLMGMGIWPFANESFAVGDTLHPFETREILAAYLRQELLGYPV